MKHILNLYIANLGKYNEGELKGGWIVLPKSEDEITKFLEDEVGITLDPSEADEKSIKGIPVYEEWAIHDYETDFGIRVNEYDNIFELNEIAEKINDMSFYEQEKVLAAIEVWGDEALEFDLDDICLYEGVETHEELGRYFIDAFYSDLFKEDSILTRHFDFEAYGREIDNDVDGGFCSAGYVEHIG